VWKDDDMVRLENIGGGGLIIAAVVLGLLVLAIFKFPIKIIFKLIINTVMGFVVLLVLNYAGGFIGISVAVNWINAVIVGVLGLPGVALILLLQWLA